MRNFIKIVTFIAGFAIIAAGCTTENDNMNFRKIERFTQKQDGDGNISFSFEQNGRTLNFEGQFGKRAIYLDNVKLWLAFPLTPVDNSPAIRNEDWTFSILPLLNNRENKLNTIIPDTAANTQELKANSPSKKNLTAKSPTLPVRSSAREVIPYCIPEQMTKLWNSNHGPRPDASPIFSSPFTATPHQILMPPASRPTP